MNTSRRQRREQLSLLALVQTVRSCFASCKEEHGHRSNGPTQQQQTRKLPTVWCKLYNSGDSPQSATIHIFLFYSSPPHLLSPSLCNESALDTARAADIKVLSHLQLKHNGRRHFPHRFSGNVSTQLGQSSKYLSFVRPASPQSKRISRNSVIDDTVFTRSS